MVMLLMSGQTRVLIDDYASEVLSGSGVSRLRLVLSAALRVPQDCCRQFFQNSRRFCLRLHESDCESKCDYC